MLILLLLVTNISSSINLTNIASNINVNIGNKTFIYL